MSIAYRAVLITYLRDGKKRRGSGFRLGGLNILTAAHCAHGVEHSVVCECEEYSAEVCWISPNTSVDIALLCVTGLEPLPSISIGYVETSSPEMVPCWALGYPQWNDNGEERYRAQSDGYIPTAEGPDAYSDTSIIQTLSFKITSPQVRDRAVSAGELDSTPWAGFSGTAVVSDTGHVLGVVRGHMPAAGTGSLVITPIAAIDNLEQAEQSRFWDTIGASRAELRCVSQRRDVKVAPLDDPDFGDLVKRLTELSDLQLRALIDDEEYRDRRNRLLNRRFGSAI